MKCVFDYVSLVHISEAQIIKKKLISKFTIRKTQWNLASFSLAIVLALFGSAMVLASFGLAILFGSTNKKIEIKLWFQGFCFDHQNFRWIKGES